MVRTRGKGGGGEEEEESEFLTIRTRSAIASQKNNVEINGYISDESGPELADSRVRHRRHRRTLVVEETDDSSDETPPRRATRRGYKEELEHDVEDEPVRRMRRSRRPPNRFIEEHHSGRGHIPLNGEIDGIRRSTRQKKLLYGTFDQKMIDKHLQIIGEADVEYHEQEKLRRRQKRNREVSGDKSAQGDGIDMYSRVKRPRRQVRRNMYGIPVSQEEEDDDTKEQAEDDQGNGDSDNEEEDEEESSSSSESEEQPKSYFLREHRPRVTLYDAAPAVSRRMKPKSVFSRDSPPRLRVRRTKEVYQSPARRSPAKFRKRRAAFHGSSSTSSSSSSDSSDDEERFERRKAKSMAKSRSRCLPMNLLGDDVRSGILRDRVKIGSSLADVDPMNVDRSVTFESVGGLGKHIRSLKEMIIFPLLYPEVFERFKITPPRGVLFYGPPGTGKTLVARALANECSHGDRKVAFFMRKGADCLSKWVGESERQLRLLFDQAFQMRPSIIFFDEIDGLAPVRSSRQDQIHSSIVSTLLALMDGLDNRGEIVVIGATNRIDSIDPALRRPGRFDREFHFPLPSVEARSQILQIHTQEWNPKLSESFLTELAEKCVGYCGADLKALCTEACLHALRRRYPQIYATSDKLELDVSSVNISAKDFQRGMENIVPTAQRSVTSPGRALCFFVQPLLQAQLQSALRILRSVFPPALSHLSSNDHLESRDVPTSTANNNSGNGDLDLYSDEDDTGPSIYDNPSQGRGRKKLHYQADAPKSFLNFSCSAADHPWTHRPRMLLSGHPYQGQSSHLAPAILHAMERLPVHVLDLPSLFAVSAKTPEESCSQVFLEARRMSPSIIYIPHIEQLWRVVGDALQATFLTLLNDMEPSCPVLLLATCDTPIFSLPDQLHAIFGAGQGEVVTMRNPTAEERRECFSNLLLVQAIKPPSSKKQAGKRGRKSQRYLEVLPKAKPPEPRKLTEKELKKLRQQEEQTLRELRIFLRDTLTKLGRDRKFGIFTKPVDIEEVPDYYDIIKNPMDLSTMMSKIDLHKYNTVKEFLSDIDLICSNALEYNPDKDPEDRAIRHRACALRDAANAIIEAELDKDFEKQCEEIAASRNKRGEAPSESVPAFYYTKPQQPTLGQGSSMSDSAGHYSMQSHRLEPDEDLSQNRVPQEEEPAGPRTIVRRIRIRSSGKKRAKLSPWCKPSRVVYRKVVIQIDEDGNEIWPEWYQRIQKEKEKGKKKEPKDDDEEDPENDDDADENEEDEKEDVKEEEEEKEESPTNEEETKNSTVVETSPQKKSSPAAAVRKSSPRGRLEVATESTDSLQIPHNSRRRDRSSSPRVKSSQKEELGSPVINGEIYFKERTSDEKPVENNTGVGSIPHRTRSRSSGRESEGESQSSSKTVSTPKSHNPISSKKSPGSAVCDNGNCELDTDTNPGKVSEDVSMDTHDVSTAEEKETKEEPKTPASTTQPQDTEEMQELSVRITRSQRRPQQVARATQILEEVPAPLVVDKDRLRHLLERTVEATDGCTVEQLTKLYSVMNQCIYHHRSNADKTQMVQELENSISKYCGGLTR